MRNKNYYVRKRAIVRLIAARVMQTIIGLALIALPLLLGFSGFLRDDHDGGMLFLAIPLGVWMVFTDDMMFFSGKARNARN